MSPGPQRCRWSLCRRSASNARNAPLRDAVFVKPVRGGRTFLKQIALDQRDHLIRDLRDTQHPNASAREAARAIHLALSRFEAGPWRRLHAEVECPARYENRVERGYRYILRTGAGPPRGGNTCGAGATPRVERIQVRVIWPSLAED